MPDRRPSIKSKYTKDRNIPGAFEGETVTRRRLMTGAAHGFGGLAVAAFALPALGFALGPVFERTETRWEDIGLLSDLPTDVYVPRVHTIVSGIGEAGKTTSYIRRHNPKLDGPLNAATQKATGGVVAVSTRCNHLGCPVRYTPAAQRFICPCHGGVYDFQGKVAGGPPVRPLDRFYTRVRNDRVEIGPRFSVNSELKRYSPRDPGEPIDGIGQYAYPSRISPAKP